MVWCLAGITTLANLALQVDLRAAVLAGLAVAVFDEAVRRFPRRVRVAPVPTRDADESHGLSRAEVAVMHRVCRHQTNRQIAEETFHAESTIDHQVESIKNKLGIHRRSELIVWGRARGFGDDDP